MTKKNGPWTIKSSDQKYKNPWIEVTEDKVVRPDGEDGIYGIVKIKEGISVLPIDDENNVYLIKEFKYPLGREVVETVGAGVDEGESPLQSARRELKEELGIEAEKWIDLGVTHPITSFIDSPNYLFIAKKLSFLEKKLEGSENIETIKVPLKKAIEMVMNNSITEQKSCCLILKAERYLNSPYSKWIKNFMDAWKNQNVKAVVKMISKNCKYYETAFGEPCSNFEDIEKLWKVVPTNQKDIEYDYKIISENTEFCIVNFFIKRTLVPSGVTQEIDGIFQISLDEKGLCSFFKQWRSIKKGA